MQKTLFIVATFFLFGCGHRYKNSKELTEAFEKRASQPADTLITSHQECTECLDLYIEKGRLSIPADIKPTLRIVSDRDIKVCGNFPFDLTDPTSFNHEPGIKFKIIGKVIKADTNNGIGAVPLFYVASWEIVKRSN